MRLSPVLASIFLLAEQMQGFQRAGAGVLEVLAALQQEDRERELKKDENMCGGLGQLGVLGIVHFKSEDIMESCLP